MRRFSDQILRINPNALLAFHAWNLKIIIVLSNHKDGMTSSELCAYLQERRSVYRSLKELKKDGWVVEDDGVYLFNCQKWDIYCQNLEKEKPIKEQDRESNKEKEKENIAKEKVLSTTFSNARDPNTHNIEEFYFSWLTDNDATMQALCGVNKINVKDKNDPASLKEALSPFINKFIQQLLAKGEVNYSREEIKNYFYNWLKIVRDAEIKKERSKRRADRAAKKRQQEAQRREEERRRERNARQTSEFLFAESEAYEFWWNDLRSEVDENSLPY